MSSSKKIIWEAYEHNHKERSPDWYWITGIVAVAGAILSIYFSNTLFAIIILLSAFTAILQGHAAPRLSKFEINRKGVRIDEIMYPYSVLESFCVIDEEVNDRIIIKSKKTFLPFIILPFNSLYTNAEEIREYLLDYLDEDELEEPFGQKLMEMIGF